MRQIAERDASALELLYDRYERAVYSFAYRIVGDPMTAEETVQELFLRVWNNAERYEASQGKLTTWMFAITRNIAVDMLRRKSKSAATTSVENETLAAYADEHTNTEEEIERKWEGVRIKEALSQLNGDQQQVIESIYYAGLTQQEVSSRFGIPLGTVKSRVRLAMRQLQKLLADAELHPDAGREGIHP
ncbi:RNA polymerase sigma-70 factor, ECF subfamily [Paenibacillus sp. OK060]|nr:ECF RNA polymerase sigma factor SigK [Paenibacillus sp. AD87]SDL69749.1 RNA polymerase sigma-70 factor, ECF subfamily [Paenibacillus sp. OK060]SLK08178.1 RNA polymerase sigma-70 factor, ECF subfamily [Paenibacillus sp. RU5A]SOC70943.1 RNA polymerase sigma-70 factor, ECF subfamily [Paenibacillus sp. RU26A]SOC73407.1 RNA polymerase sigma-70 factor, ECF subfamily [Paenibacillus sp. RU5M]